MVSVVCVHFMDGCVFCLLDIDECESIPCQNGGNCTDGVVSYTCDCIPGHTGDNCETSLLCCFCLLDRLVVTSFLDIGECASDPCHNGGICIDEINAFTCICISGYTGVTCETSMYFVY